MTGRLEGKVALITGAAAGLGSGGRRAVRSRGRAPRDRRCRRRIGRGRGDRRRPAARPSPSAATSPTRTQVAPRSPPRSRPSAGCTCSTTTPASCSATTTTPSRHPLETYQRTMDINVKGVLLGCRHAHPGDARERRRVDRQRGLVRRPHGRRHAADRLHRVEGRGAGHDPRDRRHLRPPGHPGQRPLPGTDHDAAAGQVPVRRRPPRNAAWCTSRWAASASRSRSPTARCSSRPTSRAG